MAATNLFVFSATGTGLASLGRAYREFSKQQPGLLEVTAFSAFDLAKEGATQVMLAKIRASEGVVLVIRLHGGKASCPCFEELIEAAGQGRLILDQQYGEDQELNQKHCPEHGTPEYTELLQYLKFDGDQNWGGFLRKLAGLPADPPAPRPSESLYHPRLGAVPTLDEYLERMGLTLEELRQGPKPVVGGWFFPVRWLDDDMAHVDALIQELEDQGCIPLFCFYRRVPAPDVPSQGTQWVLENYFQKDGQTIVDVFLNLMHFSLSVLRPSEAYLLERLNAVRLQVVELFADYKHWSETFQAVSPLDVCASYALPEFDANLLTVPIATKESNHRDPLTGAIMQKLRPLPERIAKVVRMAKNWAALRRKPNHEKKVAILFHNYPPRNQNLGNAIGLDSFASVAGIINRMAEEGYVVDHTYDDPQDLADEIVGGLTSDRQWLTPDAMAQRAADNVGPEWWEPWGNELPAQNREHLQKDWGGSPGELFVHEGKLMISGRVNGNVYVSMQPPRGYIEQPEKIHDPYLAPTYHYLYYYRWLRDVLQADAVMHIGCHGTLEWLPGKSVALGPNCYPDLAIMELPNIYPYILNNPSEGTQTKRRSFSCLIDHLTPVMTNAEIYDELAEMDLKIQEYHQIKDMNPKSLPVARRQLWELTAKANLDQDLGMTQDQAMADFEGFLETLHGYLSEMADTAIAHGLHILGEPPEGEGLVELATQIVRARIGDTPSLREALAAHWDLDYDDLFANRGAKCRNEKFASNALALQAVHEGCLDLVRRKIDGQEIAAQELSPDMTKALDLLMDEVVPRLRQTTDEMESVIHALAGQYVPPGGSGNPTRGQLEVLPTGRNFYTVDPEKVPSQGAWETGVAMAEKLLERYQRETGEPLDTLGMVIWDINTMRNQGEDIAQSFYLMGIKPVWNPANGKVVDIEVMPLEELKHPRVDITFRASGCFRDTFPNVAELMDRAVMMVAALQEPHGRNFLRRNVEREVEELAKQGLSPEEAFREATFRVYSCQPGTYGAGVCTAIDAKAWETRDDLGEAYVTWGGFAYGQGVYGAERKDSFRRRLKDIKLVVKNEDSREFDLFSSDDFNSYFGGFIAAVRMESGVQPLAYAGDASDPNRIKYRSVQEEIKHLFRSRLLNPKWINSMKAHGFKGAGDISRNVDYAFHWDATSNVIDDWMYQEMANRLAFDQDLQDWYKQVNPYALHNIAERLLEAINREMWQADPETQQKLETLFLETEGDIEDSVGDAQ